MDDRDRRPRSSQTKSNRSLLRRTIGLMVVMGVLVFIPLVVQLFRLQIVEYDTWKQRAANQQTQSVAIAANRGTIYDSEGRALAMSATVYQLILSPRDVVALVNEDDKKFHQTEDGSLDQALYDAAVQERRTTIVNWLANNLGLDEERLWTRIKNTASAYERLATELEEDQAELVRQFISDEHLSNSLYLVNSSKRYYPFSSVASHILGFMNQNENSGDQKVGAMGIEAIYEDALSGELGRQVYSKNGGGTEMMSGYEAYFDAQNGYDLTLTIDERIQSLLEQALTEGIETYDVQAGAFAIAIDPRTGAVLGMASSPEFDPNSYDTIIDQDLSDELAAIAEQYGTDSEEYGAAYTAAYNAQMRNKALSDTYEPGSTFKPLTVAMALEQGIISLDDHYFCGGSYTVAGRAIKCSNHSGHGDQTLTEAVANSCNVAMMQIAEKIGASTFYDYLENYGLKDSTGIDLAGEGTSLFWGRDEFTGPYGAQSLAVASFGQTFKVTPIQMISAFASVINGGHLMEPYVVQSIRDDDGNIVYHHEANEVRQTISESVSEKIRGILEYVVNEGGGHNAYQAGYRIAGKTGTSEKIELKATDPDNDDVICSFMGYAPADDPQVLVLLAYDTPKRSSPHSNYTANGTYISGGNLAAPMAGKLIASILDYMGVEKQYTADELSAADVSVRGVTGIELTTAMSRLKGQGLTWRTVGSGATVTRQVPSAGTSIPGGSTVVLYLGDEAPPEQVEVPALSGLTPAAAKARLEELGLFLRASGAGDMTDPSVKAITQSIEAGTAVAPGTVVDVQFTDNVVDYNVENNNDDNADIQPTE